NRNELHWGMIPRADFTGLILAGGLARRMQGDASGVPRHVLAHGACGAAAREKGLTLLRGEPLVAHACRALAPQVGSLLISANRHMDQFAQYGQVVSDDVALGSNLGPLAGVVRGLDEASTPWLAVMPVDVLGVPPDMVSR